MKKIISLLLSAFMLFGLCGCNFDTAELEEAVISGVISGLEDYVAEEYPDQSETEAVETQLTETAPPETEEATQAETTTTEAETTTSAPEPVIDENGVYTTKDDVALYIYTYGRLPDNFITKKEAQALGWEGGSLEPYAPGKCIGGSYFGNYEGLLPEKDGRKYTECDIDTLGAEKRGAKRIVFSNDGLIYYTDDHYESFELLYGEE